MRIILVSLFVLLLSACGFHLRGFGVGGAALPFKTLYVNAPAYPALAAEVTRAVESSGKTQVVDHPRNAQAILQILGANQEKRILSLSGSGRVSEFMLIYRLSFSLKNRNGDILLAPQQITQTQDFSFSDTEILSKEAEESQLYANMRRDAIQQLLRRLSFAKAKRTPDGTQNGDTTPETAGQKQPAQ